MKRLTLILLSILFINSAFSQSSYVYDGWIRTDLNVGENSSEKVRQNSFIVSEKGANGNVWLESAEGWLKLCYSIQLGSKKDNKKAYQESVPIFDQGFVLWELGKLHRLEGPFYFFEFKIFSISDSNVQGKNTKVSLYYRWVISEEPFRQE